uniref:Tyrosinase copper-binding domain-containing protein n=1 Tax=Plectus sambesii TaxID=2011161 RepID=A0A914X2J1_9BILA
MMEFLDFSTLAHICFGIMSLNITSLCILLFASLSVAAQSGRDPPPALSTSTKPYDDSTSTEARSPQSPLQASFALEERTKRTMLDGGGPNERSGDCFREFPQLAQRFTWEQLEFFCQQKRVFDEIIFGNESITPFTDAQRRYLDQFKMDLNRTNDPQTLAIRQEIRSMSEQDRRLFVYALRSLKKSTIDGVSKYDLIVMLSHPVLAPGAHVGAAFLPWHREYLRL